MSRRRNRPFHKRWHGDALQGYEVLTLEERGAYTTLLDQMYDYGGPIRDDPRFACAWLNCDVRVWKRLRSSLVDQHRKLRSYTDENGLSWLVNDRVQSELDLPTYAELSPNLSPKFAIATAELTPKSDENVNKNNEATSSENPISDALLPLPIPEPSIVSQKSLPEEAPEDTALRLWNDLAAECGLAKAKGFTDSRRKHLKARLTEHGLDGWREAIEAVRRSAFLRGLRTGKDGRAFKAHIDFLLQPTSMQRAIEGLYGDDAPKVVPSSSPPPTDPWRTRVRFFAEKGRQAYWNTTDWGPKPGKPGCVVPPEILADFGLGGPDVVVPFPATDRSAA